MRATEYSAQNSVKSTSNHLQQRLFRGEVLSFTQKNAQSTGILRPDLSRSKAAIRVDVKKLMGNGLKHDEIGIEKVYGDRDGGRDGNIFIDACTRRNDT